MPRCHACRRNVPAHFGACPGCQVSLLAPDLAPRAGDGLPEDSLAPSFFDGPRLTPADDLAAAIAAAEPGSALELGPGTYRLVRPLTVAKAIALNGVGADQTKLVSLAPDFVIHVIGDGLFAARGLTIAHEGRTPADVLLVDAADCELQDCRITGGHSASFPGQATGRHGRGLVVTREGSATARGCRFDGNTRDGVALEGDAAATLLGCVARGNQGAGVLVAGRAHGAIDGLVAEGNYLAGLVARDDAQANVRRTRLARGGGFGAMVMNRARAGFDSCDFDANARSGLAVWHQAATAVRACGAAGNAEHGLDVREDASAVVEGFAARDNRGHGLVWADRAAGSARGLALGGNGLGDTRVLDAARPQLSG